MGKIDDRAILGLQLCDIKLRSGKELEDIPTFFIQHEFSVNDKVRVYMTELGEHGNWTKGTIYGQNQNISDGEISVTYDILLENNVTPSAAIESWKIFRFQSETDNIEDYETKMQKKNTG